MNLPVHEASKKKLSEAEAFFSQQWLTGTTYIDKTLVNKKFGRNQANLALNQFFVPIKRGTNISRKITQVIPKELDMMPEQRVKKLMQEAVTPNTKIKNLKDFLKPKPTKFDHRSVICVKRSALQQAIGWCIHNKKYHLIKNVRILLSQDMWEVFYVEKSYRFFAVWPFCLSNWPVALRNMILHGTSYDFTNAIGRFTLEKFLELEEGVKKQHTLDLAVDFLKNAQKRRDEMAAESGILEEHIKRAFHGFLNGASTNPSAVKMGKSALLDVLTAEEIFKILDLYSDLIKQLKMVRKIVIDGHEYESFIKEYFKWEQTQTSSMFAGSGLIMHDGIDGCSIETKIPEDYVDKIKTVFENGFWSLSGEILEITC